MKINLKLSKHLVKRLFNDDSEGLKFISVLTNSSIFTKYDIFNKNYNLVLYLKNKGVRIFHSNEKYNVTIVIQEFCIFDTFFLEEFINETNNLPENIKFLIPNIINHSTLYNLKHKDITNSNIRKKLPLFLILPNTKKEKNYDTCFINRLTCAILKDEENKHINMLEEVTTIVRFHKSGNLFLLKNALLSLLAQVNCIVNILLTLQDLSKEQYTCLSAMIETLPLNKMHKINYLHFSSNNEDIRSKMFNDAFRIATTKFISFLDYDDILFNDAHDFLIQRLKESKKNATFGCVYASKFDDNSMIVLERNREFENALTYQDFLISNHAPIHSIMFNKELISLGEISYFDKMKYMEDYYFTLQIFNENDTDWESLKIKRYIGEYMYSKSNHNTLAFTSTDEKEKVRKDALYIWCEKKINELKYKLVKQRNLNLINLINLEKDAKIIFFGTSKAFLDIFEDLEQLISPNYLCDNDINKHGKYIKGYKVYSPQELFNKKYKFIVIITSSFYNEIQLQLQQYSNIITIENYSFLRIAFLSH